MTVKSGSESTTQPATQFVQTILTPGVKQQWREADY
jgi:hypothetical protein